MTKSPEDKFEILAAGEWTAAQVCIHFENRLHRLPGIHAARSLAHWQQLKQESTSCLFNGDLFRLDDLRTQPNRLDFSLSVTCYRDQLYSDRHANMLAKEYGASSLANGIGVSALVISADGFIPIIRRADGVVDGQGQLDVIGGHAHPSEHLQTGDVPLFTAIADEVMSELDLTPEDFTLDSCYGVLLALPSRKPEVLFLIHSTREMEVIRKKAVQSRESFEFSELFGVSAQKTELERFVLNSYQELTPSALGCLLMYCRHEEYRSRQPSR